MNKKFLIFRKNWLMKFTFSRYRGRIGSILPLSLNIGILALFVSDIFLSFLEIGSIALALLFLFLCFFAFFPDTPKQLYKIRKQEVNILNFSQIYLFQLTFVSNHSKGSHWIAPSLSRHPWFGMPNWWLL